MERTGDAAERLCCRDDGVGRVAAIPVVPVNACGQGVDSLYFRKHLCTA